jgi:hypothetical protein
MDVVDSKTPRPWIKLTAEKMAEFESKTRQQTVLAGKRRRQAKPVDESSSSSE